MHNMVWGAGAQSFPALSGYATLPANVCVQQPRSSLNLIVQEFSSLTFCPKIWGMRLEVPIL